MAEFIDNKVRKWQVAIDAPTILMLRKEADPDFMLGDTAESNTYKRLEADPVLLCRVVFLLCQKQLTERDVSEEDFYKEVIGNAIEKATKAILEAILDFTPRQTTRDVLRTSAAVDDQIREVAAQKAIAKINDPELRKQAEAIIESELDSVVKNALTQLGSATSSAVT